MGSMSTFTQARRAAAAAQQESADEADSENEEKGVQHIGCFLRHRVEGEAYRGIALCP